MPELPEVEVVRLFLTPKLKGQTITALKILSSKPARLSGSFSGDPKKLIGKKIKKITRHGKQLSIHLSNHLILLIHLKMTGQLVILSAVEGSVPQKTILGHSTPTLTQKPLPHRSTRLIFTFSDNSKLFFNDQRKFGWIRLLTASQVKQFQSVLGPDLLSSQFTPAYFYRQLQLSCRPIKSLLHDQNRFAGIGNIYANDALFLAGIHPLTPSKKISSFKSKKLRLYLLKIIRQSIKAGGSTARDNQYTCPATAGARPDGTPGANQYNFRVYQKQDRPCLVCSTPINRLKISGRSAFFCPRCQKPVK